MYWAGMIGFRSAPSPNRMLTGPERPSFGALTMAEKIALPLVWVQLHCETVAFFGVAETVMDDGHGALPVLEKVFCATHPGRVRITFVFAHPEALT